MKSKFQNLEDIIFRNIRNPEIEGIILKYRGIFEFEKAKEMFEPGEILRNNIEESEEFILQKGIPDYQLY